MRYFFLALFLLTIGRGVAQEKKVDSLRVALVRHPQDDTVKINILLSLGKELHWLGEYDEVISIGKQVEDLSSHLAYKPGKGQALIMSGQAQIRKGNYDVALRQFQDAVPVFVETRLKVEEANAHLYMGQVLDYKGKFREALKEYDIALHLIRQHPDEFTRAKIINSMGITYFNIGSYEIALEQYQKVAKITVHLKNDRLYASVLNNIGAVYAKLSQHTEAIRYFKLYLEVMEKLQSQYFVAVGYLNIGESYKLMHRDDLAMVYIDKAIGIQGSIQDKRGLALSYSNLADIYARKENIAEAQKYYTQSIALAREIRNDELLMNPLSGAASFYLRLQKFTLAEQCINEIHALAYKTGAKAWLQQCYLLTSRLDSAQGNYSDAYTAYKQFSYLKDSLFNNNKSEQIIRMQELFQSERKDKEIRLLSEENKLAELERINSRRLFMISIVFLSLIILGMVYWLLNNTRHAKQLKVQKEEIRARNEELKSLLDQIEDQNDILLQRNQSLEELHREKDGLMGIVAHDLRSPLNRITGLSDIITLCGELNEEQKAMIVSIQKVCDHGRGLIKDLLAIHQYETLDSLEIVSLKIDGFVSSLLQNYRPMLESKNMRVHFNPSLGSSEITTDQGCLTRILDNLLTNAIKFSQKGTSIYVDIREEDHDAIEITVRDEGPGFSKDDLPHLFQKFKKLSARPTNGESSTGLGLAIVKLLVEKLNGTIRVESEHGKGASFTIQLPVRQTGPEVMVA